MALLAVNNFSRNPPGIATVAGGTPASVGGDEWVNSGAELFVLGNASGAPVTVTFITPPNIDNLALADLQMTVPAGQAWIIGPFPPTYYNNGPGRVQVTYSAVASVTVKVLRPTGIVVP